MQKGKIMASKNQNKNVQEVPAEPAATVAKQYPPVEFDVRIQSIRPSETVKASASVNINGAFAVTGIKVIESAKGLFVPMPSYKKGEDFKDICFPITSECRKQLNDVVISAYEQEIAQIQSDITRRNAEQQAPEGQAVEMTGM